MSSWQRHKRNTPWLLAMILLAVVYGVLLFTLQTLTGRAQLDGIIGIVLGLYVCSHPAANLVDLILFGRFRTQPVRSRRDLVSWWGLNALVMFLGLAVIFSGMTRFLAQASLAPIPPATTDGLAMVYVPGGPFTMGDTILADERPIHTVTLDAFWIDKYEVSNAAIRQCQQAGACRKPNPIIIAAADLPATQVTWQDAADYCAWAGERLPTEAQWEKAARGPDGRAYPWGNTFNQDYVNSAYNLNLKTAPVDQFPQGASPYGAYNMAGNVWEWVADWYGETYYAGSPAVNPTGPISGEYRVARGGGYGGTEAVMRTAMRRSIGPDEVGGYLGFRCAR